MNRLFDWLMFFAIGLFIIFAVLLAYKGVKSLNSSDQTNEKDYSDDFLTNEDDVIDYDYEDTDDLDQSTLDAIKETANEVKEEVTDAAHVIKEEVGEKAEKIKDGFKDITNNVKDKFEDTGTTIKETIEYEEEADLDKDLAEVLDDDEFSEKGVATPEVSPSEARPSSYETITTDIGYRYIVVAGTFSKFSNAEAEQKRFERKGYNGEVVRFTNSKYHTLSLGKFRDESEGRALVKKLKAAGIDCYLHTKR